MHKPLGVNQWTGRVEVQGSKTHSQANQTIPDRVPNHPQPVHDMYMSQRKPHQTNRKVMIAHTKLKEVDAFVSSW